MSASAEDDPPSARPIELPVTEEQDLRIRKAAELLGWTVPEYILAAVLDRAERDLYQDAVLQDWDAVFPASSAEPITSFMGLLGESAAAPIPPDSGG
jgi:uncharacterized protein (DUF1778 family)